MSFRWRSGVSLAVVFVIMAGANWLRMAHAAQPVALTSTQIVDEMQRRNQWRTNSQNAAKATRHYEVEYRGFSKTIVAKMEVEYSYTASTGKSFRIVSQSGSKMLCDKVLKRAVESEKEASQDQRSSAMTATNYNFKLLGSENLNGRPTFILDMEPLTASKFLMRGKIWVDAADFAVVKIEAEPAKNPSFWISRTRILQTFVKTGDFWPPERNWSETKVRVGGTAVFTIDYGTYQIESNGLR